MTARIAMITHLYDRLRRGQPIVRLTREMWIAVCLLGWAFLTVPFSYWSGGSLMKDIVNAPGEAFSTFARSGMDMLVLDRFIVEKR